MEKKNNYRNQKVTFLFDENIPRLDVERLRLGSWKKYFNFISVYEIGRDGLSDVEHFNYCKKKDYVLITRDRDFSSNKAFPIQQTLGIVNLINPKESLEYTLENFLRILEGITLARLFLQESKIKLSRYSLNIEKIHISKKIVVKEVMKLKHNKRLYETYKVIEDRFGYPAAKEEWEIV